MKYSLRSVLMLSAIGLLLNSAYTAAAPSSPPQGAPRRASAPQSPAQQQRPSEQSEADMGDGGLLYLRGELGLSAVQVESIQEVLLDTQKKMLRLRTDQQISNIDLSRQMRPDAPDFAAAKATSQQIADTQHAIRLLLIETREKTYAVLTDEQKKRFSQIVQNSMVSAQQQPKARPASAPERPAAQAPFRYPSGAGSEDLGR